MKVLVGALVGLVLGAAIVAGLTVAGVAQSYWPILVVAVVAGIAMSRVASASTAKYTKGGLAAVATALAMIAGQVGAAQILSNQASQVGPATPAVKLAEAAADEAADAAEGEEEVAEVAVADPEVILPVSVQPAVSVSGNRGGDISPMDIGFFAVGCLIAYQLGKGGEGAAASPVEAADEPAADPGDADPVSESDEEA